MLHLTVFGGLSVSIEDAPGVGAAQQRKTLALLTLLAAPGPGGMSRDKLVAYLWPDADADHARGLLKQACYALRRDLQQPDLFLGTTQLRLNPSVIGSDVQAFEAALERRDDAQAAALYTGSFLDGFYLGDSLEFERWVESERSRLRQRACGALERLATAAAAHGDHGGTVEWWQRLAGIDRLNSRVALGLMQALAVAGDRAGALQFARVHETLVREELDATPDAAVLELRERLRAEAEAAPVARGRAVVTTVAPEGTGESSAAAGSATPEGERVRAGWRVYMPRKPLAVGLALVVASLLAGGWFLTGTPFGAWGARSALEPKKLVVLPFTNLGPADDQYFADGITDEIAARLAAVRGLQVIGSRSARVYKGKPIAQIGRELGVDYVLDGSVRWQRSTEGAARVRVTPQLLSTKDGAHVWAEVYDEPLDEIFRVHSEIAQKVVRALDVTLGERQRRLVEAVPTRSIEAYDYYLRGYAYSRRGSEQRFVRASVRMYESAVQLDTTFALAYAMLARANNEMYWMHWDRTDERRAQVKRAVDRALELDPDLPAAHLALGQYYAAGLDYERALQKYAQAEPALPFLAAGHIAVLLARQGKVRESVVYFQRAAQLDPADVMVAGNHAHAYDLLREFPRAEALYNRAIALGPDRSNPYAWKAWMYLRWDGRTEQARRVLLEEARSAGVAGDPLLLRMRVMVEVVDGSYEEAIRLLGSDFPEVIADQYGFIPRAQLRAQIYGLMRRPDLERAQYDSARIFVLKHAKERLDDARLHSALGIAYAGLGHKQEAIQEGEQGAALLPVKTDALRGHYRELDLARIYTMVGEHDLAIARLEYLLSVPGYLTVAWLRLDPTWDPLRSDRRFQALLARK